MNNVIEKHVTSRCDSAVKPVILCVRSANMNKQSINYYFETLAKLHSLPFKVARNRVVINDWEVVTCDNTLRGIKRVTCGRILHDAFKVDDEAPVDPQGLAYIASRIRDVGLRNSGLSFGKHM